jgi:hypothetical protein
MIWMCSSDTDLGIVDGHQYLLLYNEESIEQFFYFEDYLVLHFLED